MIALGKYSKTITALVTGVIGWGIVVVQSPRGTISASEWIALAVAVAVALGVWAIPNTGTAPVAPVAVQSPPLPPKG